MRIYLASSWKNAGLVRSVARELRNAGHEVDAFCDGSTGRKVFSFGLLPAIEVDTAQTVFRHQSVVQAYEEDRKWLDWAEAILLILPAGKSAHLEAGYAAGAGKHLIIYQDSFPVGEYDVMYGFADLITTRLSEVNTWLLQHEMASMPHVREGDHCDGCDNCNSRFESASV